MEKSGQGPYWKKSKLKNKYIYIGSGKDSCPQILLNTTLFLKYTVMLFEIVLLKSTFVAPSFPPSLLFLVTGKLNELPKVSLKVVLQRK